MASKDVQKRLINEYEGLLRKSPYWVRIAFKAFLQLPDDVVENKTFLSFFLGTRIDEFKFSHKSAKYGLSEVVGQNCSNCIYLYTNNVENKNICMKVRGSIRKSLWCKFWENKK